MPAKKPPAFVAIEPSTSQPSGAAYVPDLGPVSRAQPPTKVEAAPPFLLTAHPERWTVMGGKVVPLFGRLVLQAGVGGVSAKGGGKLDAADARNMAEDRGWRVIPVDAVPDAHASVDADGRIVKSYLYRPEGRPDVTLLRYTKCFPGSAAIEVDEAGYLEFCDHLVTSGVIAPPQPYALEKLRARMEHEVGALVDRAREQSQYAGAAEAAKAQLAVVTAALEAARQAQPSGGSAVTVDA
jgi:hypothetical protein